MKKPLAIQLEFDVKDVRKALAILTGDVMSDEEINAKFFDRETVKIDTDRVGKEESFNLCMAFVMMILGFDEEQKELKKEPKKSKFQERLEAMQKQNQELKNQ